MQLASVQRGQVCVVRKGRVDCMSWVWSQGHRLDQEFPAQLVLRLALPQDQLSLAGKIEFEKKKKKSLEVSREIFNIWERGCADEKVSHLAQPTFSLPRTVGGQQLIQLQVSWAGEKNHFQRSAGSWASGRA